MPLYNVPPSPPTPDIGQQSPVPKIYPADYRHSVVSAKTQALAPLLTHIEGSTWVVDYYAQVLGADEEPTAYAPGQLDVYQQYRLVRGFVLKLQGSLTVGEDQPTMEMQISGSAVIFPGTVKPNFGDAFIADIGDGRAGIFVLDTPQKNTLMKETCYNITFTLRQYADADDVLRINNRVVDTLYYRQDFLTYGKNPVVTEGVVTTDKTLKYLEATRLREFLADFYSDEYSTLLVPSQSHGTYDKYVTRAIVTLYDRNLNPMLGKLRELNCDGHPIMEQHSLYDLMISLDSTMLPIVFKQMQMATTRLFHYLPYMNSIRFSGLKYLIMPTQTRSVVDKQYVAASGALISFQGTQVRTEPATDLVAANLAYIAALTQSTPINHDDAIPAVYLDPDVPLYHAVGDGWSYVLSDAFYAQNTAGYSKFEHLLQNALTTQQIPTRPLLAMAAVMSTWEPLDRFYYTPLLLIMLKISQGTLN